MTTAVQTAGQTAMAEASDRIARAWELSYLDPITAREIGRELVAEGGAAAGAGWLQVALAEVRVGEVAVALDALC